METETSGKKPFYEEPFTPPKKMVRADLERELSNWRNLWSWLDNEVKGWLVVANHNFKFVRSDYRTFFGKLGKVKFEPVRFELDCVVEEKDYIHRRLIVEVETMHIAPNRLIGWSEVHEHKEIPMDDRGELLEEVPLDDRPEDLEAASSAPKIE